MSDSVRMLSSLSSLALEWTNSHKKCVNMFVLISILEDIVRYALKAYHKLTYMVKKVTHSIV